MTEASYCKACNTHNGKHKPDCSDVRANIEKEILAHGPDPVEALRRKIAVMRELGVTEADGIKLGPAPAPPKKEETPEEAKARMLKMMQRHHEIMFAASSTKPKLRAVK